MIIIIIIVTIVWVVLLAYWVLSALQSKRNLHNYNWRLELLIRFVIIVLVILFLRIPSLHRFAENIHSETLPLNSFLIVLGFIFFILGIALTVWARISLGKNWGMPMTIKENPDLVKTGPYSYIRHPIYSGVILAMFGTAFAVTIYWIIPLLIVSIYFLYSLKKEEQNLVRLFPKEYEKYKKNTHALIPFIY